MRIAAGADEKVKVEVFAWLDYITQLINDGRIETLKPAPWYERREVITDEIVERVIDAIESYFLSEITNSSGYHRREQGAGPDEVLITPGFDKMPAPARRALVERYDEILMPHRIGDSPPGPAPAATNDYGGC